MYMMNKLRNQFLYKVTVLIGTTIEDVFVIGKNIPAVRTTVNALFDDSYDFIEGKTTSYKIVNIKLLQIVSV